MERIETSEYTTGADPGWEVVRKRNNRKKKPAANDGVSGKIVPNGGRILAAKTVITNVEDESNGAGAGADAANEPEFNEKAAAEEAKKITVPLRKALESIDYSEFVAFLANTESYADTMPIQIRRFLKYFRSPLIQVGFPWLKMFYESPWPKLIDMIEVPLSDIPEPIYKASVDWINHLDELDISSFIYWAFGHLIKLLNVLYDLGAEQPTCTGREVTILITLAMALRTRPKSLIILLPTMRDSCMCQKYIPFSVWMMAQASLVDLSVGLRSWAHNLFPLIAQAKCDSQKMDLILQFVEKIFSDPKAQSILVNEAVKKGKRLVPPSSFEILLRLTFLTSSKNPRGCK